jgi:hypothetical protein
LLHASILVGSLTLVDASCGGGSGSLKQACKGDCDAATGEGAPLGSDASNESALPPTDASGDLVSPIAIADAPSESATDGQTGGDAPVCGSLSIHPDSAVFVAPSGADSSACGGSAASPCASIGAALASARFMVRSLVVVAPGTYVESVQLIAGVTVQGGWQVSGISWSYDCSVTPESLVTIEAPGTANVTVLADSLASAATLRRLTVRSKTVAQTGESLFGILARGQTQLTLDDVAVSASKGGEGASGSAGAAGSTPASTTCSASDGNNATTPGTTGTPGAAGVFNASGYSTSNGGAGGMGNVGDNGTMGQPGQSVPYFPCNFPISSCNGAPSSCVGGTGFSGCGGGRGAGGTGGGGGGSSVALYAYGAAIVVQDGSFTAGDGGAGGAGGAGGPGASGSSGAMGAPGNCTAATCSDAGADAGTTLCVTGTPVHPAGGAAGGVGGSGSQGGAGGGGARGNSYAILGGGGATVQLNGAPPLVHGAAGTSKGNGPSGVAAGEASF